MSFLRDMVTKGNSVSTMRVLLFFVVVFVILDVFGTWTYVSILKTALQGIDATLMALVSAVIGILATAKVFEKQEETKTDISKPPTNS